MIVARAERDGFFSGWSAPTVVNAIAPFDLGQRQFPDSQGPELQAGAQIREHSARGKVTIYLAKGRKKGKFHKVGKAKISKKGRFTKRFTVRHDRHLPAALHLQGQQHGGRRPRDRAHQDPQHFFF